MDRAGAVTRPDQAPEQLNLWDEFVLPSRVEAMSSLLSALKCPTGPVVLTGESGVGKSWVCSRLREALPPPWRWAVVNLSPAIHEAGLYHLILHSLGTRALSGPADARTTLAEIFTDSAEDGIRWGLLIDDAQNASPGVMEELRILGNRMGESGSLGGLVLVGQTALARRLTTRSFAPLQARISTRVHLRPLDVDEFRIWIDRLQPGRVSSEQAAEWLHRETGGNPRKTLARILRPAPLSKTQQVPKATAERSALKGAESGPFRLEKDHSWDAAPLPSGKPPIQIGEGMIEVGWEPTAVVETEEERDPEPSYPSATGSPAAVKAPVQSAPDVSEQVIDDHYAALQAWTEWAQNQGREPVGSALIDDRTQPFAGTLNEPEPTLDPDENPAARISGHPGVWAEGQQEFAPYSQLFSRLRQPRDRS